MLKRILRIIITLIGAILGYGLSVLVFFLLEQTPLAETGSLTLAVRIGVTAVLCLVWAWLFNRLAPKILSGGQRMANEIERSLRNVSMTELLTGTGGLVIGLFIAFLVSNLYNFMNTYIGVVVSVLTYIFFGYLGISIATHRGSDVIRTVVENRQKPDLRIGKKKAGQDYAPKILDTSVIIDGRISDILGTGFIEGQIIIPDFILLELQHIADSADSMKRQRGRRGLDILKQIQEKRDVEIYSTEKEKGLAEIPEVDIKLLKLAQNMNAKVVTNDYNLNKVATITGVSVLNINDLASVLKPVVLPGETMQAFIVKEGREQNQGVAYLDDGTMIVIEDGRRKIGQTVEVTVTSVLQTSAGRMIFAKE